jgi:hypothetical protein
MSFSFLAGASAIPKIKIRGKVAATSLDINMRLAPHHVQHIDVTSHLR